MKGFFIAVICCVASLSSAVVALGQQEPPRGYTSVLPATNMAPADSAAEQLSIVAPVVSPLVPTQSFNFAITASAALGGGTYTGTILGRSPLNRGKATTTIPTQIIPLVITINDGTTTVVYDSTAPDPCVPGSPHPSTVSVVNGSPVFTNNPWTMNGVAIGNTQYIDAFQRAQFWSLVQGTPYHLVLNQSVLGSQALSFGPGAGTNYPATDFVGGTCGNLGVVNTTTLDNLLQALITGPLAGMVNAGTLPIFLTKNVVSNPFGITVDINCCFLGYHSGLTVAGNLQIYSIFSIDSTGIFPPGYVNTLSHEVAEAVNDPDVRPGHENLTPPWGNIGQTPGKCQANLEVGDPLSEGFSTPSNPFTVVGANGLTYETQELAYYSWFFGTTSLGVGAGGVGRFSNNGSFSHTAVLCPPGTPNGGPF
jgi:hypothetical protein